MISRRSGILSGAWPLLALVPEPWVTAGVTWYTSPSAFESSATDLAAPTFENIAPSNDYAEIVTVI